MTRFDLAALAKTVGRAIDEAIHRGFQPPLQAICVGANGALYAGQYIDDLHGGLDFKLTTECEKPEGFRPPVNVIIIHSATGDALRIVLEDDRERFVN
jgi:hypothetical protein